MGNSWWEILLSHTFQITQQKEGTENKIRQKASDLDKRHIFMYTVKSAMGYRPKYYQSLRPGHLLLGVY